MPVQTTPGIVEVVDEDVTPEVTGPWNVILYNDDWHSIDEVVFQVQKATGYSLERAVEVTLEAHHRGRAIAFTGAKEECKRVATVLREIRLQVEIDEA